MIRRLPLLALAFSTPAFANEDIIIVTGTLLTQGRGDLAYDSITLDRDRLTGSASGRVEDALRDVAGLQQFRRTDARSANATSQGATLRGLGGNASSRALLVLDGVPQSDPFGGWVTWPAYDGQWLSSVRITRGGGAGAYGPGALSGTIEMTSLAPQEDAGSSASLAYGSRQSVEAKGLLSGGLGGGFGFIAANYARGDGFVPIIARQRGTADRAAPYEQASLHARAVMPLSAQTEMQASLLGFTDRRTRGTILSGNGGDGADASLRIVHAGRWAWTALTYLQMRKFQSRFVSINAARDTVLQTVDQHNVPSTGMGAKLELRPPVGARTELRIGIDWRRTTGVTKELFTYVAGLPTRSREAGGESNTLGAYAEATAELERLTLTGGVRADYWSITNGRLIERTLATSALIRNDIAPKRTGWEPTGRVGVAWKAAPALTIRSAAYVGWRLPTLNELYRPFRVGADATAANPTLKPERMKGAEVGFDWFVAEHARISATAFANRLDDAIANVSLGNGPGTFPGVGFVAASGAYRQRQNLDAISARGLEIDASYRVQDWRLQASYAYTRARVKGSGLALPLNGLRPAQVPSHMASATIGWKGLSLTGRYVSSQFEDDGNTRALQNAITLDAVADIPVSDHVTLFARGENMTNARVEAAISGNGIIERASPRTLWVGIRVKR
jgi:vitamin B12 transporter